MKNKLFNESLTKNKELYSYKQYEAILKENERLKKLNSFTNFQEFLDNSYTSPIINASFYLEDKRVFGFMKHISKYLIKNTKKIKNKPLVSILMYTYNGENVIQNAISSVLKQTYTNWELIIINDGSTDNSLDLINSFLNDKIKIISYDEKKGYSHAYNLGLTKITGKYIMYLDSNSEWDPTYIETMIGAFIELPNADAIYSGQLLYKENDNKPYAVRYGSFNKPLLYNRNYIDLNCFCHENQIYKELGGFDENLNKLSGWDYVLRINSSFKIYSIPVLLSKHYEVSSLNNTSKISSDYEKIFEIFEKNLIPTKKYKNLSHRISIIIPNYESLNEVKRCVETILSFNLNDLIDIIVIDNNSSILVKEYLKKMESEQKIKLIQNNSNYGFIYAIKQGIDISDETTDILILNSDAILTEGAIEHLQEGAYTYKDCGLIVPHEISEKNISMNRHVPYANPELKCDITPSEAYHNIINMPLFHDGELLELNFAPFFCIYIKREVYDKTLGLDSELDEYESEHVFSDFIRNILKMKIYQEPHAYVYHEDSTEHYALKNKEEFNITNKGYDK